MSKLTVVSGGLVLCAALAFGQGVPGYVNYQGRLTDAAGAALATRDYDLTFRIYDAATGGTLVWGPLHFDVASGGSLTTGHRFKVPVVQGYFNVMLGEVDESNRSVLTAFNAVARYVEVTVEDGCPTPPCSPILPRQQVLSAPYAVTAANVLGTGNVFPSSGSVGIGTTTPGTIPLAVLAGGNSDWSANIYNANADGKGLLVKAGDGSGTAEIFKAALGNESGVLTVREDRTVSVSGKTLIMGGFGSRNTNTTYQAASDGFVVGYMTCGGSCGTYLTGNVGPTSPSTTVTRGVAWDHYHAQTDSIFMPVPSGYYWRVDQANAGNAPTLGLYWIPFER